jgi:hypothetical protein
MSWYTFGEILGFMIIAAVIGCAVGVLIAGLFRYSGVKAAAARRCRDDQRVRDARHTAEVGGLQSRLVAMEAELEVAGAAARHWREEYDKVATQLEVTYAQSTEALAGIDELRAAYDQRRAELQQLRASLATDSGQLPPAAP